LTHENAATRKVVKSQGVANFWHCTELRSDAVNEETN
jgi:hypothetical protein